MQFAFVIHQQLIYLLENFEYIGSKVVMFLMSILHNIQNNQGFPFVHSVWFSCKGTCLLLQISLSYPPRNATYKLLLYLMCV